MEKQKNALGRRKEAVTRVFISRGEGKITVNDKDYKAYFPLGIARALLEVNPEFRPLLKAAGQLTRDPRGVERKKFGHKKARRSYQFSKR